MSSVDRRPRETGQDIDRAVHRQPTPEAVARLYDRHGAEAAYERWWWLSDRTLGKLAQMGRARLSPDAERRYALRGSAGPDDRAVAFEAAVALGSRSRGERAAGLRNNAARAAFEERGLLPVPVSREERSRLMRLSHAARRGDQAAVDALQAQADLELAVGEVVRQALRLVPEQPRAGRYRLPEPGPALTAALAGLDPPAVQLVFGDAA